MGSFAEEKKEKKNTPPDHSCSYFFLPVPFKPCIVSYSTHFH